MAVSIKTIAARMRIVGVLRRGPMTAREISDALRREVLESWAEANGYDFEWFTDEEPVGARLLAISSAQERGLVHVGMPYQVDAHLRALERTGAVQRIQIEGHRPILWQLPRRLAA